MMSYYTTSLAQCFNNGKNLWLLKVTSYNRGFGIELFNDLMTCVGHLNNFRLGYEENLDLKVESGDQKETSKTVCWIVCLLKLL